MDQLVKAVNDGENLQRLEELLQSGVVDHLDEKTEDTFKSIIVNLVNSVKWASGEEKNFARHALVRILRRAPESSSVYDIPAIMASNYKLADIAMALMLKGGSPTRVNPNFLQSYLARHNEGVEPYFVEAAQMEFAAYSQGKSLRVYAEEQRRPLSLEEVLERIEGQSGGRRKRHHKRKTHRKRGRSYTRRHRRRRSYH